MSDDDDSDDPWIMTAPITHWRVKAQMKSSTPSKRMSPSTEVQIYPNPARDVLQVETESMLDRWM